MQAHNKSSERIVGEILPIIDKEGIIFYGTVTHDRRDTCKCNLCLAKYVFNHRHKTFKLCLKCLKKKFHETFKEIEQYQIQHKVEGVKHTWKNKHKQRIG